jgi:agmatinase
MGLHAPHLPLAGLHVAVLGVPYDGSVSHRAGAAAAPAVLRELSRHTRPHTENLVSLRGLRLRDVGDAAVDQDDPAATQLAITCAVRPIVSAGAVPMVLGGDHSITSAVLAAFDTYDEIGILWLDSHPDLMDSYRGPQGKAESRWNHACPLRRICELPNVRPENVLIVGLRDYIEEEITFARQQQIEALHSCDLGRLSPGEVVERIGAKFARLPAVYISCDIDVLDPACAPATGVPIPGGISTRYLYDLVFGLFERERAALGSAGRHFLRLAGFDLVEVAPAFDRDEMTSEAGLGWLTAMLGYVALQSGLPDLDI